MRTIRWSVAMMPMLGGCDGGGASKDTGGASLDTAASDDDMGDTGESGSDDAEPVERCDGIDNDGDGRIDEAMSILWFDAVEDEIAHTLAEGVRTFRMHSDGKAEMTNLNVEGVEGTVPTWVITSADGTIDASQAIHYSPESKPLINTIEYTDDSAIPLAEVWTYDDVHGQRTDYRRYESDALAMRQTWSEFTTENTPNGLTQAQRTQTDTGGINLEKTCITGFESGSWQQECDYTMAGTPYYRSVVHYDHADGLYTSGWAEITLLAEFFGETQLYSRTEYAYDDRGQRSETRSYTASIGSAGEWTQVVVTRWTRDDENRVVRKEELTEAGERLSVIEYGWLDGRTELAEIDEDADGEVDVVKSAVHVGDRLVAYMEERVAGEHPTEQDPPLALFVAEYDDNDTLTVTRTDWDGDGTWDIVRTRSVSCEAEPSGFDPDGAGTE